MLNTKNHSILTSEQKFTLAEYYKIYKVLFEELQFGGYTEAINNMLTIVGMVYAKGQPRFKKIILSIQEDQDNIKLEMIDPYTKKPDFKVLSKDEKEYYVIVELAVDSSLI